MAHGPRLGPGNASVPRRVTEQRGAVLAERLQPDGRRVCRPPPPDLRLGLDQDGPHEPCKVSMLHISIVPKDSKTKAIDVLNTPCC